MDHRKIYKKRILLESLTLQLRHTEPLEDIINIHDDFVGILVKNVCIVFIVFFGCQLTEAEHTVPLPKPLFL